MSDRVPVWSWQDAIRQAPVPPGTKLLCFVIATYLSDAGRYAWPSMAALIRDTRMSQSAITTHLKNAVAAGLLLARRQRRPDGTLGGYTYQPCFPDTMELPAHSRAKKSPVPKSGSGPDQSQNLGRKRTIQEREPNIDKDSLPSMIGRDAACADATVDPMSYWDGGDK